MAHLIYDFVSELDIPAALEIEKAGFTEDEAATEATFRYRQSHAPQLFLGAYELQASSRTLIGYICSTLSPDEVLKHESMTTHVPGARSVCIHSVCVAPAYRRKGLGLALLKEYLAHLEKSRADGNATWDRVLLLAHEDLIPFYEKAGFENVGRSSVVHGALPWYELRKTLQSQPTEPDVEVRDGERHMPAGVFEALKRKRDVPASKLISEFPGGMTDLTDSDEAGTSTNKYDLLCPRATCGSIILRQGVGRWVERASVQMEPVGDQNPHLASLPTPPETAQWWLISPSPMEFENIGLTRPVQSLAQIGRKLKLLTCAECDLGPLGWSEEGGTEFWLAASRVSYRT